MTAKEWKQLRKGSIIKMKRTRWIRKVLDYRKESTCISLARKWFGETVYHSGDRKIFQLIKI